MEAISVSRVFAFCKAHKLLNLVHLLQKLLILSVDKFNLAFLTDYFLIGLSSIEVFTDRCVTGGTCCNYLKAGYFLIAHADFLIEQENVVFELCVQALQFADVLSELVASVICSTQLLSPNFLGALICARLAASATSVRSVIITRQSVG